MSDSPWTVEAQAEWGLLRLKHVCRFVGGGTPDTGTAEYWRGDIPWVSPKDMKSSRIRDAEDHISEEALSASASRLVGAGAVLIVMRSGILRHSIPVAVNEVPVALNQDMKALLPDSRLLPEFLARLIEGHQAELLKAWRKEGTTVESLEFDLLSNTLFPVPPADLQRAIADYLDREAARIDALIAAKERLLGLLAEKRQALITRAVTRGLDPNAPLRDSGIPWLGPIPAHWKTPPVYARFEVQLGKMLDEKKIKRVHLAQYLRNVDVQWDLINTDELPQMDFDNDDRSKYALQVGDILVCEGGEIGRSAVWGGGIDECYYQKALHRLRPLNGDDDPSFFVLAMRVMVAVGVFLARAEASTINHLPAEKLRALRYPAPPLAEQQAIVTWIQNETAKLDKISVATERTIALLKERRSALIAAAVTGQIPIPPEPVP